MDKKLICSNTKNVFEKETSRLINVRLHMTFRPTLIYIFVLTVFRRTFLTKKKIKNRCLSLKKLLHKQLIIELNNAMPHFDEICH